MVPAVGQGALAVQCRDDDRGLLAVLEHNGPARVLKFDTMANTSVVMQMLCQGYAFNPHSRAFGECCLGCWRLINAWWCCLRPPWRGLQLEFWNGTASSTLPVCFRPASGAWAASLRSCLSGSHFCHPPDPRLLRPGCPARPSTKRDLTLFAAGLRPSQPRLLAPPLGRRPSWEAATDVQASGTREFCAAVASRLVVRAPIAAALAWSSRFPWTCSPPQ